MTHPDDMTTGEPLPLFMPAVCPVHRTVFYPGSGLGCDACEADEYAAEMARYHDEHPEELTEFAVAEAEEAIARYERLAFIDLDPLPF